MTDVISRWECPECGDVGCSHPGVPVERRYRLIEPCPTCKGRKWVEGSPETHGSVSAPGEAINCPACDGAGERRYIAEDVLLAWEPEHSGWAPLTYATEVALDAVRAAIEAAKEAQNVRS